jgi:predicted metal-dependent hydrolase
MTDLVVRRLLVDMEKPIARHWCAGDPFRTALINALSMSFPVGEQFFIDSVRSGFAALPPELQEKHRAEVQGFVGQEARIAGCTRCTTNTSRARVWWTTGPRAPASALR